MTTNWLNIALMAGLIYAGVFAYFTVRRQWTWAAMSAALANFMYVLLNLAAPFRGTFDPGYAGYNVGLLQIAPGPLVTLVSGSIVIAALSAACLALLNRPGRSMIFVALVGTFLLLAIGLPELLNGLMAPAAYQIRLGEYLQVPGLLAVLLSSALLFLPLLFSVVWSSRRIRPRMTDNISTIAH